MEKLFIIKFILRDGNVETQIQNKNVPLHEAIGLLEIAKSQLNNSITKKNVLNIVKGDDTQ